ncbi:hypothetical protein BC828DRAFT_372111 [Blastocladiella britannica]|nr:hypothetical protein BC828DRAFT_372111 [Blastocladiella britannica]
MATTTAAVVPGNKQLFATHSLQDLAAISAKLRNDAAKKDAALGVILADNYQTLLAACSSIDTIRAATVVLRDSVTGLRRWHPSVRAVETSLPLSPEVGAVMPPAISLGQSTTTTKTAGPLGDLDLAWSHLCAGSFQDAVTALDQFDAGARLAQVPSIVTDTVATTASLMHVDLARHAATATAAAPKSSNSARQPPVSALVDAFAAVQTRLGNDNEDTRETHAATFLAAQRTAIVADLARIPTSTAATSSDLLGPAVDRAVVADQVARSLLPPAEATAWTAGIRADIARAAQRIGHAPASPRLSTALTEAGASAESRAAWGAWIAALRTDLHRAATDAVMRRMRALVGATTTDDHDGDGHRRQDGDMEEKQKEGADIARDWRRLVEDAEGLAVPADRTYHESCVRTAIGELCCRGSDIGATMATLTLVGETLGVWDHIHAALGDYLKDWTRDWAAGHADLLAEPCTQDELPRPGLVRFLFEYVRDVCAAQVVFDKYAYAACNAAMSEWIADAYRQQVKMPRVMVLADLLLVDRVCETKQTETLIRDRQWAGPDHEEDLDSARAIADAAALTWGTFLLPSTSVDVPLAATTAATPVLPLGYSLDPIERAGVMLPSIAMVDPMAVAAETLPRTLSLLRSGSIQAARDDGAMTSPTSTRATVMASPRTPIEPGPGSLLFSDRAARFLMQTRDMLSSRFEAAAADADLHE